MKKTKKNIKYKFFHWGPFLFRTQITSEECQIILEEGKRCRNKLHDYRSSLAGYLSEEYGLNPEALTGCLEKYFNAYCAAFNKWRGEENMKPGFRLTAAWVNYMKANEFNPPHSHENDISFIVYPHIPPEITKEHKDFKGNMRAPGGVSWEYGDGAPLHIRMIHVMPETGDLFIFPSSLLHWVLPFKSNVERISVSGNVLLNQDSRKGFI